jgi:endonuclease/exonuclease/phosphatase family metal-dependent hydrolase
MELVRLEAKMDLPSCIRVEQKVNNIEMVLSPLANKNLIEWEPVSERIMIARFKTEIKNVLVVQCYALSAVAEITDKLELYSKLRKVLLYNRIDICIVMGDLNAKLGAENEGLEHIMGKHGIGEINENGQKIVDFCADNDLVIGGTIFPHERIHKVMWVSPDHIAQNQIDHICIARKWRKSLLDVRSKRGADIGGDHHLVMAVFKLRIMAANKTFLKVGEKLDVKK